MARKRGERQRPWLVKRDRVPRGFGRWDKAKYGRPEEWVNEQVEERAIAVVQGLAGPNVDLIQLARRVGWLVWRRVKNYDAREIRLISQAQIGFADQLAAVAPLLESIFLEPASKQQPAHPRPLSHGLPQVQVKLSSAVLSAILAAHIRRRPDRPNPSSEEEPT